MRILLDENIPVQLRSLLAPHEVASVNDASIGWKSIKNHQNNQSVVPGYALLQREPGMTLR